jgi:hypothetical protein
MTPINITDEMIKKATDSEQYKQLEKALLEATRKALVDNPFLDPEKLQNEVAFKLGIYTMQIIYGQITL